MADSNQELDLRREDHIGFLSADIFEEMLVQAMNPLGSNQDSVICRFSFVRNKAPTNTFVNTNDMGKRAFTPAQVTDLVRRYSEMITRINQMVQAGFKIERVDLGTFTGYCATGIEFFTPANRKEQKGYHHSFENGMIPDDFLYDLKMLPSRHG